MSEIDVLRQCEAMAQLSDEEVDQIATLGSEEQFDSGSTVIQEGERATCFYLVLSGRVQVLGGGGGLAEIGVGEIVGEMSIFNADVRTSSVVALEPSRLMRFATDAFASRVLHHDHAAVKMMEAFGGIMMRRLEQRERALLASARDNEGELAQTIASSADLRRRMLADWALKYHSFDRPGKLEIRATKPVGTAADLSVAYSPGVAQPCIEIRENKERAYDYTARGNLVGVITNGTAVLGLGDIGAEAAKPVMEGKAVLFKHFADIDAFDIEVDEKDPSRFIDIVCSLAPTFGGINLEDIRAPECFEIERECQRRLDIPVFHDDQHGTAIIAGAGLLNALELVGKKIDEVKVVFSGAGAAGFATARYLLSLGVARDHLTLCDFHGVVYLGRGDDNYLDELALDTPDRTLGDALAGADVFVGLSAGNILSPEMLLSMASDPIVFALANPTPEIDFGLALQTRSDVVMASGRSDTPNQVNNVIAFPFLFRGALDCRARCINEEMKRAATHAIAALAKEPSESAQTPPFGREYVVPKPFDPRLRSRIAPAVAEAAMKTGVARRPVDLEAYREQLESVRVGH